jgi:hypothetical protein
MADSGNGGDKAKHGNTHGSGRKPTRVQLDRRAAAGRRKEEARVLGSLDWRGVRPKGGTEYGAGPGEKEREEWQLGIMNDGRSQKRKNIDTTR